MSYGAGEGGRSTSLMASSKAQLIFRIVIVLAVGVALAAASFAPGMLPKEHIPCIRDELFVKTASINKFFANHTILKNAFMIF